MSDPWPPLDDTRVHVKTETDGTALIWLPDVTYLDTQAGPVEVGLDPGIAQQLFLALGRHLCTSETRGHQVVGWWGVDGADSAEQAVADARRSTDRYPNRPATAYERVILTFEDDSAYTGPWVPLDPEGEVAGP